MPATTGSILTNIDRTYETKDPKLIELLETAMEKATAPKTDTDTWAHEVWAQFIVDADEEKYADHIPGTVGYKKRIEYGTLLQRGRKPEVHEVKLTDKQQTLVGDIDFSAAPRFEVDGNKIIFTARTPIIRALRKAARGKDSRSRQSLAALVETVRKT